MVGGAEPAAGQVLPEQAHVTHVPQIGGRDLLGRVL